MIQIFANLSLMPRSTVQLARVPIQPLVHDPSKHQVMQTAIDAHTKAAQNPYLTTQIVKRNILHLFHANLSGIPKKIARFYGLSYAIYSVIQDITCRVVQHTVVCIMFIL